MSEEYSNKIHKLESARKVSYYCIKTQAVIQPPELEYTQSEPSNRREEPKPKVGVTPKVDEVEVEVKLDSDRKEVKQDKDQVEQEQHVI